MWVVVVGILFFIFIETDFVINNISFFKFIVGFWFYNGVFNFIFGYLFSSIDVKFCKRIKGLWV